MSGIEKVVVPLVVGGAEAGTDPKVLSGGWLRMENAVFPRAGAVAKRPGQSAVTIAAGNTRATAGAAGTILWGGTRPTVVSDGTGAESPLAVPAGWRPAALSMRQHDNPDVIAMATVGNVTAYATARVDIGPAWLETVDAATGVRLDAEPNASSSVVCTPQFVTVAGQLQCWALETDGGGIDTIARYTIDSSTGAISSASYVTIAGTDRVTGNYIRACTVVSGGVTYVCLVYQEVGGELRLVACPAGNPAAAANYAITGALALHAETRFGVFALGSSAAVAWYDRTPSPAEVRAKALDPATGATTVSDTVIGTLAGASYGAPLYVGGVASVTPNGTAGTVARIVFDRSVVGTATLNPMRQTVFAEWTNTAGTGGVGGTTWIGRMRPFCDPVLLADGRFMLCCYSQAYGVDFSDAIYARDSGLHWLISGATMRQPTTLQRADMTWVGRALSGRARPASAATSGTVQAWVDAAGRHSVPTRTIVRQDPTTAGQWGALALRGETDTYSLGIASISLAATGDALTHDGVTYFGGALPSRTDARGIFEHGFSQAPDALTAASSGAGYMTAGNYRVLAIYEHVDASGRREQSRPTDAAVTVTLTTGTSISVTCAGLSATNRGSATAYSEATAVFYRTLANQEQPFYRVGSASAESLGTGVATFGLVTADADVAKNERLYTTGGVVENSGPPPYERATMHGARHCVIGAEDGKLYYSLPTLQGGVVNHSAFLTAGLNLGGETATALRSYIDRLVVWTASAAYIVDGQGYNALGSGDNFRDAYPLISAVGCANARSIVATPGGLAYASQDSIWLLTPRFQAQNIGGRVQHYFDTQTIVDAVPMPSRTIAMWVCSNGAALVYDYAADAWSTWTNHSSIAACGRNGNAVRLEATKLWTTSDARSDDDGAFVAMRAETGWIAVSAWQRVYELLLIGQARDTVTVNIKLAYDHDPVWVDNYGYGLATLKPFGYDANFGDGLLAADYAEQSATLRVFPSRQKCAAMRLHISDAKVSAASAKGFELSAVQLLVGAKSGLKRTSTARQVRS